MYLKSFKNALKVTFKSELPQKDFSSIMLKLHVTSRNSPEIVRTTLLQNTSVFATSVFYM